MSEIRIEFTKAGTWADQPSKPVFEVEAGDERMVTHQFAQVAVNAGKAKYVIDTSAAELAEKEAAELAEKEAAEAVSFDAPAAGPVAKAEGKKSKKGKK